MSVKVSGTNETAPQVNFVYVEGDGKNSNLPVSVTMTTTSSPASSTYTYYAREQKLDMVCSKCGRVECYVDMSVVLTSMPEQYAWRCRGCGDNGYVFCHQVKLAAPEAPAQPVAGSAPGFGVTGEITPTARELELQRKVADLESRIAQIEKALLGVSRFMVEGPERY